MAKKKNLVGIAKSRKPRGTKKSETKVEEKKEEKIILTPEEERNIKAKAKVEELLHDSPIMTLDKKKEVVESENEEEVVVEQPKGVEWLEEQVLILSQQNEALHYELEMFRAGGSVSNGNDVVTKAVIALFDELQQNHIKLGVNPQTGVGNFRIYCPGFLNRMIKFFPFLEEYKRY